MKQGQVVVRIRAEERVFYNKLVTLDGEQARKFKLAEEAQRKGRDTIVFTDDDGERETIGVEEFFQEIAQSFLNPEDADGDGSGEYDDPTVERWKEPKPKRAKAKRKP